MDVCGCAGGGSLLAVSQFEITAKQQSSKERQIFQASFLCCFAVQKLIDSAKVRAAFGKNSGR